MPGAQAPQAAQTAEPVSQRCESCGALMKQVAPQQYVCEYCGNRVFPKPQPVQPVQPYAPQPYQPPAQPQKNPEDDILDSLYAAAKRLLK